MENHRFPISTPAKRGHSEKSRRPWWAPPRDDREIEETIEDVRAAAESPDAPKHRQMIANAKAELSAKRIEELVSEFEDEAAVTKEQWWTPPTDAEIAKTTLEVRSAQESPNAPLYSKLIREGVAQIRKHRVEQLVKELEDEAEPETEN